MILIINAQIHNAVQYLAKDMIIHCLTIKTLYQHPNSQTLSVLLQTTITILFRTTIAILIHPIIALLIHPIIEVDT